MNNETIVETTACQNPMHRHVEQDCYCGISWSGVFAGAFVGIGLAFLFHLLTSSIGLSAVTRTVEGNEALAFGVLFFLFVGNYVIFFVSGWTAGKIARPFCAHACGGMLYGFLSWVLALLMAAILFSAMTDTTNVEIWRTPGSDLATQQESLLQDNRLAGTNTATPAIDANTQKDIRKMGLASFAVFLVFFAAALGSTLGGYYATAYYKRNTIKVKETTIKTPDNKEF